MKRLRREGLRPLWIFCGRHKTFFYSLFDMAEVIYNFEEGPYDVLEYSVKMKDGKAVIEVNGGDLGRLPVEDLDTVEQLREALNEVEEELKEVERRGEEL